MNRSRATLAFAAGLAALPALAAAQAREVTTAGFDAQRTNWIRSDVRVNRGSVEDGSFKLLWKHTFPGEPRQLESLTQPVLLDFLVGYVGFKSLAFFGGADDVVFSIDTDLAKPYWTTHLTTMAALGSTPGSTWRCPGGLMAAPSRVTPRAPTGFGGPGGGGGGRATSAVGEPGKGAAALSQVRRARPTGPPSGDVPPPPAGPTRNAPSVPFGGVDPLWTMGSDGWLRTVRVTDGGQVDPPVPFLPPNARPSSLISVDGLVYTSTSNDCGNAPNGVWALDLLSPDKKVTTWKTGGANVAGSVALGTSGIVYAATGLQPPATRPWLAADGPAPTRYASSVVALDRVTLEPKDWFTRDTADFNATPVVFRHKGKDYVAVTGNDGRLYLLDGTSLGGSDHKTPLFVTDAFAPPNAGGGLATWQDADGTRWVLAPGASSIVALKVVEKDGKAALEPGWRSRQIAAPLAPVVLNGIVFAAASGEHRGGAPTLSAADRAKQSTPAVLYALDAVSGKELWSSGSAITSFARAGLAAGGGQVYLVTYDNTLYAFGIPLEH
ncbi:MAG: PQQ-binding-like beta-propeller repeat protein [Vicinamibacteraceae bacterium]